MLLSFTHCPEKNANELKMLAALLIHYLQKVPQTMAQVSVTIAKQLRLES